MKNINFPEISFPIQGINSVPMPQMVRIRQKFEDDKIEDITSHLQQKLEQSKMAANAKGKELR